MRQRFSHSPISSIFLALERFRSSLPLVCPKGLKAPLSLGTAEPHPAREPQPVRVKNVFLGCDFFKFKAARIESPDLAALSADRAFVGQIGFAVVGDLDRPQRKAFRAFRFRRQLPRQEDVFVFEHQIPMLAIVCSVM